jgi:hypothetical protein
MASSKIIVAEPEFTALRHRSFIDVGTLLKALLPEPPQPLSEEELELS